jgi:hypothetical protein
MNTGPEPRWAQSVSMGSRVRGNDKAGGTASSIFTAWFPVCRASKSIAQGVVFGDFLFLVMTPRRHQVVFRLCCADEPVRSPSSGFGFQLASLLSKPIMLQTQYLFSHDSSARHATAHPMGVASHVNTGSPIRRKNVQSSIVNVSSLACRRNATPLPRGTNDALFRRHFSLPVDRDADSCAGRRDRDL